MLIHSTSSSRNGSSPSTPSRLSASKARRAISTCRCDIASTPRAHGFQGLLDGPVDVPSDHLAVAEHPQVYEARLQLRRARPPDAGDPNRHDHNFAGVCEVLGLDAVVLERLLRLLGG